MTDALKQARDAQIDAAIEAWFTTPITAAEGEDRGHPFRSRMRAAIAAADAALARADVQAAPVAWQWRRKNEPWSLERTFNSEVKATTADSEVRALYAAPPAPAAQQEPAQAVPFTGAQTAATTLVRVLVEPAQAEPPPDGFELLWVRNLGPLLDALDRAEEKGYLPDAMADQWAAFEFRQAKPAGGAHG